MKLVHILIFLFNVIIEVKGNEDYVPTLVWTSREFYGRKNIDYLVLKKIKSDLFESYIMEVLGGKRPLIMLFLEQNLGTDDFQWKDKKWDDYYPFLSNLTINSRVDYFQSVQSPHKTITQFTTVGYKIKSLKPGGKFTANEGDLWVLEFKEETSPRPETMKNHDQIIEEVHNKLMESRTPWISIYTARHCNNQKFISDLMQQLSPWHVEGQLQQRSPKAISIYTDHFTRFSLVTKGSIQLYLPSFKNLALKNLDNYLGASAKPSPNKMDFFIWFPNYTLTFHLINQKKDWVMQGAKLVNGNGDSLTLAPRQNIFPTNKCYVQLIEFQSKRKPIVKIKLHKYKFLKLSNNEMPCEKPYRFHVMCFIILISLIMAASCWNRFLQKFMFSQKPNILKISLNEYMTLSSRTVPCGF